METLEELTECSSFRQIISVLNALSETDGRIIDEFSTVNSASTVNGKIVNFTFNSSATSTELIGKKISWKEFAEEVRIKAYDRIMPWVSPEEVRDFIRKKNLTQAKYNELSTNGELPKGFPSNVRHTYSKPWSWFSGITQGRYQR